MHITRVGIDTAKNVFHVHAIDRHGRCQWQAKLKRERWVGELCERVPTSAEIAMEACGASHHWGRELQRRGYTVRLIGAQFVKPFVKSNKNDRADALAIVEAMGRPEARFVAVKSVVVSRTCRRCTASAPNASSSAPLKANQIRGLVGERHRRTGRHHAAAPRDPVLARGRPTGLPNSRMLLAELQEDLQRLDERETQDAHVKRRAVEDPRPG